MLAVALANQLRVLQNHLDKFRDQIEKLFAKHPDHDLFGSLPGAGGKLAPRLLAELGDDRERFDSPQGTLSTGLSQSPAAHRSPMGQPQSNQMSMGTGLLPKETRGRSKPRLCAPLPGPALAEDPLEDVAEARAIRS